MDQNIYLEISQNIMIPYAVEDIPSQSEKLVCGEED